MSKIVRLTEWTSLNTSVNSVAQLLSGSAGVILISVNLVIKSNVVEIMYQENLKISCRNVRVKISVP